MLKEKRLFKRQEENIRPIRHIINVSLPVVLAQTTTSLIQFFSVLFLSYVSANAFAASMYISSIQLVAITVPYSIFFCVSSMVSRIIAEGTNPEKIGIIFQATVLLSLVISGVIGILFWNMQTLLLFLGQPIILVNITSEYFYLFLWAVPLGSVINILSQIILGFFKQKFFLIISIFNFFLTIALSYIFIFGILNFKPMGIRGLALASIIQSTITLIIFLLYITFNKTFYQYHLFRLGCAKKLMITGWNVLRVGIPICLQTANELLSFFVITIMCGWLGAQALMAKQIVIQYLFLLIIPLFALSQASSILVGHLFGKKASHKLVVYGNESIKLGVIYSFIILLLFIVCSDTLVNVFIHAETVNAHFYHVVATLLIITAVGQIFDSIRNIAAGALRGLEDTAYSMAISIICIWPIGISLAYLFGFVFNWGLIGIAIGNNIAIIIAALFVFFRWLKISRKMVRVLARSKVQP